jgi:hypothetical protein
VFLVQFFTFADRVVKTVKMTKKFLFQSKSYKAKKRDETAKRESYLNALKMVR